MTIKCEAEVVDILEAGEFTDDSGKTIKFGKRSSIYVKFPNEKFHSLIKVKGEFPLGQGVISFDFAVSKDKPILVFKGFAPAIKSAAAA